MSCHVIVMKLKVFVFPTLFRRLPAWLVCCGGGCACSQDFCPGTLRPRSTSCKSCCLRMPSASARPVCSSGSYEMRMRKPTELSARADCHSLSVDAPETPWSPANRPEAARHLCLKCSSLALSQVPGVGKAAKKEWHCCDPGALPHVKSQFISLFF